MFIYYNEKVRPNINMIRVNSVFGSVSIPHVKVRIAQKLSLINCNSRYYFISWCNSKHALSCINLTYFISNLESKRRSITTSNRAQVVVSWRKKEEVLFGSELETEGRTYIYIYINLKSHVKFIQTIEY